MHNGYKTSRAMIARPSLAVVLVMVSSLLDVLLVIPGRKEVAFAPSGPFTGGTLHCCTAMRLQLVGVCNVVIVILLFAAIVAVGFSTLACRPKFAGHDPHVEATLEVIHFCQQCNDSYAAFRFFPSCRAAADGVKAHARAVHQRYHLGSPHHFHLGSAYKANHETSLAAQNWR